MSQQPVFTGGQLALDLTTEPDYRSESFAVSESNASALAIVNRWPDWRQHHLLLIGPRSSGKTHLATIWQTRSAAIRLNGQTLGKDIRQLESPGSILIEDIDRSVDETGLFHLLNRAASDEGPCVLMTGTGYPEQWNITLPDLASRLKASETAILSAPDDALLRQVLEKLFRDRRTPLGHGVINYLLPRMERSVEFARRLVIALDHAALSRKSPVSRQMAGDVLDMLISNTDGELND